MKAIPTILKKLFGQFLLFSTLLILISGCSLKEVSDRANDVKKQAAGISDDVQKEVTQMTNEVQKQVTEISNSEVKQRLQESLQKEINSLKSETNKIVNANGQLNWQELQKTQIAQYVFFSAFNYEFKAVLKGDGTVEVLRLNTETREKTVYATYKVLFENGTVKLQ